MFAYKGARGSIFFKILPTFLWMAFKYELAECLGQETKSNKHELDSDNFLSVQIEM